MNQNRIFKFSRRKKVLFIFLLLYSPLIFVPICQSLDNMNNITESNKGIIPSPSKFESESPKYQSFDNMNNTTEPNKGIEPSPDKIESESSKNRESDRDTVRSNVVLKPRSWPEIYLSLGVLLFGLIAIILVTIIGIRKDMGWNEASRLFAVSIIVTAGLFLMTAGYDDKQIAPMFGLLGAIAGYVLGKVSLKE